MRRSELAGSVHEAAPRLLGAVIEHRGPDGSVAVRLTEVEAYDGADDPGSHAYRGPTRRNEVMFGPPGHVYVYFTYGMHWCMNLVCGPDGTAGAVLLRAGEVIDGIEVARSRRPAAASDRDLARGPARLASALGVARDQNGVDACHPDSLLRIHPARAEVDPSRIRTGPRVGLAGGADLEWRYWLDGEATVSTYRPHSRRRRTRAAG